MKIDRIILYWVSMPLVSPFTTSFGTSYNRDCILIEAHSGDLIGWGECVADLDPGYGYETTGTAGHILRDFLIPVLLRNAIEKPREFPALVAHVKGHQMAKAGLEMALWDLEGKRSGKSLQEMLGGMGDRVAVGVSVGLQENHEALVETVAAYLDTGYRRVKIKIKPGRDIADARAVRKAFPDLPLQVDANSAYTLESAEALQTLDELGLLLIEQPLSEDDLWDHSRLQPRFKTPLCLDESIISLRHARQAIEMGACRIINIKTGRVGGLTEALKIHDYCQECNVPVWCGGMLETGIGRAANLAIASLPGFRLPGDISATDRYYQEDIITQRFTLNPDSSINVPQGEGLGVHIDRKVLARVTQSSQMLAL